MRPERGKRRQMRPKLGVKGREKFESLPRACMDGFVRGERGTSREVSRHCGGWIIRRKNREARHKWSGLAARRIEILRGAMQQREHRACGVRVCGTAHGRPGEGVFVKVDALRNLVDLVGPLACLDGRFAGRGSDDTRDQRDMGAKMSEETMLLEEAFAIAHRTVVAFDKDALTVSVLVRVATTLAAENGRGLRERMCVGSPS